MSALGQKQTCAVQNIMSALLPKADMCGATSDVRFGPKADIGELSCLLTAQAPTPQWRANSHARSRSASSPPAQPINDRPTGHPLMVPAGMLICGKPEIPAVQFNRITRVRNSSSSAPEASILGAILGEVGNARTVPDVAISRMCSRALAITSRFASAWDFVTVEANAIRSRTPGPILGFWVVINWPKVCQVS